MRLNNLISYLILRAAAAAAAPASADCCAGATVFASCFGYANSSTATPSVQRAIACGGGKTIVVDYVPGTDGVWATPPLFINGSLGGAGLTVIVGANVTLLAARGQYHGLSDKRYFMT